MENNKSLFRQYNEERVLGKTGPQIDMFKVMDSFKKSVDYFNSYGIETGKDKDNSKLINNKEKKPLTDANQWFISLHI